MNCTSAGDAAPGSEPLGDGAVKKVREFLIAALASDRAALEDRALMINDLLGRWKLDSTTVETLTLAIEVLDGEERAYRWLTREHPTLEGEIPLFLLVTGRAATVTDLLGPLRYGFP